MPHFQDVIAHQEAETIIQVEQEMQNWYRRLSTAAQAKTDQEASGWSEYDLIGLHV